MNPGNPNLRNIGLCVLLYTLIAGCATQGPPAPEPVAEQREAPTALSLVELQSAYLQNAAARQAQEQPTSGFQFRRSADRKVAAAEHRSLESYGRTLLQELRARLFTELEGKIAARLGTPAQSDSEWVPLEAVNDAGEIVEIPVAVETRPLRRLSLPRNSGLVRGLVAEERVVLPLYDHVPPSFEPTRPEIFMRIYDGEAAAAIAMEAKLIVDLKGGAWDSNDGTRRTANGVAIRGLDFSLGFQGNSNRTYDDTLFLCLEGTDGSVEVLEYRMTTESSSEEVGVGRLLSKQVTYQRGLHRGEDPAYRLKGNAADGTRNEMDGQFKITGANIHSAYSRQPITSATPLRPNVSLGCQVVAASKRNFENRVVALLDKKGVSSFPYTIVEDDELQLLDSALQEQGQESILLHRIPRNG